MVFDNGGYGEIRAEMADAVAPVAVDLPARRTCRLWPAPGLCRRCHVADPAELAGRLTEAFARAGPTVITVPEETAA